MSSDLSTLVCNSCHIRFDDNGAYRAHYQTEWHRFNIKRKCAAMPPVTVEEFEARKDAVMAADAAQAATPADSNTKSNMNCAVCRKNFSSKNAFDNHLESKKHRELEAQSKANPASSGGSGGAPRAGKMQVDAKHPPAEGSGSTVLDPASGKTDEQLIEEYLETVERLAATDCLFCTAKFDSFEKTMDHVTKHHSFFIPDIEYVVNLESLYLYYGDKVAVGRTCVFCGQLFNSLTAVRDHMFHKGHSKLPLDEDDENLDEYYDYSSSYPEGMDVTTSHAIVASGANMDLVLPPGAVRKPVDIDETGYSLILSDGTTIGHRALRHIYKQRTLPEYISRSAQQIKELQQRYKMLGWKGEHHYGPGKSDVPSHVQHQRAIWNMRLGQKANKLQHHFRNPNPL
eukprot:comp10065_c0_seq1/m.11932 comp10065_c0_seq1/g.11932  ORF comp10065_c0_seq1/g.11932 comp10065_c0_seq1/m.11932 type:complete len:399 (+) comp10065_c0_seq1:27-1223(+)